MSFVCPICAHTQSVDARCESCGRAPTLDTTDPEQRAALEKENRRWRRTRSTQFLSASVVLAIVTFALLNQVRAYTELRSKLFAMPFRIDEIAMMAILAGGIHQVFERAFGDRNKFTFL